MTRRPYCFIDGNTVETELELLQETPIPVWACADHPKDPYLTRRGDTDG